MIEIAAQAAGEPTTLIGLAGLLVVTIGGWGKAWIDGKRHGKAIRQVRDQVQNGHETYLRDDLDEMGGRLDRLIDGMGELRGDVRGIRQDIGGLRGELRDERQARSELERTVERIERGRRPGG